MGHQCLYSTTQWAQVRLSQELSHLLCSSSQPPQGISSIQHLTTWDVSYWKVPILHFPWPESEKNTALWSFPSKQSSLFKPEIPNFLFSSQKWVTGYWFQNQFGGHPLTKLWKNDLTHLLIMWWYLPPIILSSDTKKTGKSHLISYYNCIYLFLHSLCFLIYSCWKFFNLIFS